MTELALSLYGGGSILRVGIKLPVQTSDKLSGVVLLDSGYGGGGVIDSRSLLCWLIAVKRVNCIDIIQL